MTRFAEGAATIVGPVPEQPLLGVVYSQRSRALSEITEAAEGLCGLLWIIDSSAPGGSVIAEIVRRFGHVVDTAGCSAEETIRLLEAEHPDGITCYYDNDLHRQAWIAAALGLPGPSIRSIALLTDKVLQRRALQEAGVAVPRFSAINEPVDDDEIDRLRRELTFPLVLKPRHGTATQHIYPVADVDELVRRLGEVPQPREMILEERMESIPVRSPSYAGRLSIDSIVSEHVVSHYGITGLFAMAPPFRSSGGFFPADVAPEDVPGLFDFATKTIAALGSESGCYRTEIMPTPNGLKIIEVNGRHTGLTPTAIKLASGVPVLELSMRLALGEHIVVDGPVACDQVGYRYFGEPPMSAERVLAIDGLEQLHNRPGVAQVNITKGVGEPVDWRNGSLDRVFQVTGAVADYDELAEVYRACTEDVQVTYQHHRETLTDEAP